MTEGSLGHCTNILSKQQGWIHELKLLTIKKRRSLAFLVPTAVYIFMPYELIGKGSKCLKIFSLSLWNIISEAWLILRHRQCSKTKKIDSVGVVKTTKSWQSNEPYYIWKHCENVPCLCSGKTQWCLTLFLKCVSIEQVKWYCVHVFGVNVGVVFSLNVWNLFNLPVWDI